VALGIRRKGGLFYIRVPISLWPVLGKEKRYFYTIGTPTVMTVGIFGSTTQQNIKFFFVFGRKDYN
jgi:hypothetical protein